MIGSRTSWWLAGPPAPLPALDGIRAAAILLVLLRHATLPFDSAQFESPLSTFLWNIARNGWLGVDLFFVLSGFLISRSLYGASGSASREKNILPKNYLLKRVLRTFPLYYAVILLCLIGAFPGYNPEISRLLYEIAVHVAFLQDFFGTNILVPLWSLATEEKFYLIAPFLLAWLNRLKTPPSRFSVLIGFIILSLLMRLFAWLIHSPESYASFFWQVRAPFFSCIDGLFLGILANEIHRSPALFKPIRKRSQPIFLASISTIVVLLSWKEWAVPEHFIAAIFVIFLFGLSCSALLLSSIELKGLAKKILTSVALRTIAVLSYALYLVHYTTIDLSVSLAGIDGENDQLNISLFLTYYVLISFLYAIVLHLLVERPFLSLKARLR